MILLVIDIPVFNPDLNLKIEESLFNISNDYLILRFWINDSCIVMGKFQDERYEVNSEYVKKHQIPVLKRFSGGGTVYHDRGNLNVTICKNKEFIIYSRFVLDEGRYLTALISDSLSINNHHYTIDERNGIFYSDKKFVGSAMAVKQCKFLYHASILVDADLDTLTKCIKWDEDYDDSKQRTIRSKRSKIINLSSISNFNMTDIKNNIHDRFVDSLEIKDIIYIDTFSKLELYLNKPLAN